MANYINRHTLIIPAIIGILVFGLAVRLQMVLKTVVITSIRSDAAEYYFYAYNLSHYGVYSRQPSGTVNSSDQLVPDAHRNPGYVLFLIPFVKFLPGPEMVQQIQIAQAVISAFTILVALGFFKSFLPWPYAISASLLVAMSPHLIAANIYVLTETVFTFFLTLFALSITKLASRKTWPWALFAGILLACSLLVRPTVKYFIIFLIPSLFLYFQRRQAIQFTLSLILGFSICYTPWIVRNHISLSPGQKSSLSVKTVHNGMYPGLMYNNDPYTQGFPHRFDPEYDKLPEMSSVVKEIIRRFKNEPIRYVKWYILGKPVMFLSWNMIVGMGDVFIYPILNTPYYYSRVFKIMHGIMKRLHWPLILLAFFASILVWLPSAKTVLSNQTLIVSMFTSLLLAYFVLVHMIGTPLPRYAIPLWPFIYGMAMLGGHIAINAIRNGISKKSVKR